MDKLQKKIKNSFQLQAVTYKISPNKATQVLSCRHIQGAVSTFFHPQVKMNP